MLPTNDLTFLNGMVRPTTDGDMIQPSRWPTVSTGQRTRGPLPRRCRRFQTQSGTPVAWWGDCDYSVGLYSGGLRVRIQAGCHVAQARPPWRVTGLMYSSEAGNWNALAATTMA